MKPARWHPWACALLIACGSDHDASELFTSREERAVLGAARDIPDSIIQAIDLSRLRSDLLYQRQSFWSIWSFLFAVFPSSHDISLHNWQSWYSTEDFQRIFRFLYTGLGKPGRQERLPLSQADIDKALLWHDQEQFKDPAWDQLRFEQWLGQHHAAATQNAIPGMNKILMNRSALVYLLSAYLPISRCYRREDCPSIAFPSQAAFLKTAWRRSGDGFSIPTYQSAQLNLQLAAPQWQQSATWMPGAADSFAMRTLSQQNFHLVGMHLMLKLGSDWLWTSTWLSPDAAQDLAADQPTTMPFKNYRLCSISSITEELGPAADDWPAAMQSFSAQMNQAQLKNWCSNPYLETGINNQKTNCVGCHQYAGRAWTARDFNQRLQHELVSLQEAGVEQGPSDQVWSLLAGPAALALTLVDTIEYFDVYDQYEN